MQVRGSLLAGAGAIVLVLVGTALFWPDAEAEATSRRVAKLEALCESPVGTQRRQMALAELVEIDSATSREALENLAASDDERLAILAVAALCRAGHSSSVEDVLEDADRPAVVRSAAMGAYVQQAKDDGRTWSQVRGYLLNEAGDDDDLIEAAGALRNRFDANGR